MTEKRALIPAPRVSNAKPVVLKSFDEVKIRSNARTFSVHICKLREKIKSVNVKSGAVVAMALDAANVSVESGDVSSLDIRVNGQPAELLQVVNENDTIYIATKVAGA